VRVHDGSLSPAPGTQPRYPTLVAGLGTPGLRDLDFGRQVVRYLQHLDWPEDVVVEDLSYAAHLVLHRIQELRPARMVLVGVAAREDRPPGSVRRYRVSSSPPPPEEVHHALSAVTTGMVDLDHTLAVVRHWGELPAETTVIEVQPADCSFGPGFSEELGNCLEPIVALVRQELGGDAPVPATAPDREAGALVGTGQEGGGFEPGTASPELVAMAEHARNHQLVARSEPFRRTPLIDRDDRQGPVRIEARSRPFGVGLGTGGDWYDAIPRPDGTFGVVVGDAAGRGAGAAAVMGELRAAVRAYAALSDDSPARLLSRLDRLVGVTAAGEGSAVTYLHLDPVSSRVRLSVAGGCPPLLSTGAGPARSAAPAGPLLGPGAGRRSDEEIDLDGHSTLFLFTAGLARAGRRSLAEGLEWVRAAASRGPRPLGSACDFVFDACVGHSQREDDAMVVALRLAPDGASAPGQRRPADASIVEDQGGSATPILHNRRI